MVHLSARIERLIAESFGKCGLEPRLRRRIELLPEEIAERLHAEGLHEVAEKWKEILSAPPSDLRRVRLIEGAIRKVIGQATYLSKTHGKPLCEHLEKALEQEHIENWLSGFIRKMSK